MCPYHQRHQCRFSPLVRGGLTSAVASRSLLIALSHLLESMVGPPNQWELWAEIPEKTKKLVRDKLSVSAYLEKTLANWYKDWKSTFHTYFQLWDDLEIARLGGCPDELNDRPEDWEWLCKHFTDPKFVMKSIAGKKARDSKTLLHHTNLKPFSYRLKARRQGSKFL